MSSSPKIRDYLNSVNSTRAVFRVSISKSKQGRQLFNFDYLFIAIESEVYAIGYRWIDYIACLRRRR